jgi:hypothetical protein
MFASLACRVKSVCDCFLIEQNHNERNPKGV